MKKRLLAVLMLMGMLAATQAQAWTQRFSESGVGSFDHFQLWIDAPENWAQPNGISNFNRAGWSQTFNDGQLLVADGTSVSQLAFNLNFEGSREPVTFHFQAWDGNTLREAATVSWRGRRSGWQISAANNWINYRVSNRSQIPVAEPSTVLMFGLGMAGIIAGLRRKPQREAV